MDEVPNNDKNIATLKGNRLQGKFVSKNVKCLFVRNLYSAEIYFYQKGLNLFVLQQKWSSKIWGFKENLKNVAGNLRICETLENFIPFFSGEFQT